MDLADVTTGGLPSEPGDFLNELNDLLMADNGQPEAEPEAPALPQFEPMLTANAAWHNLSGEEFASAMDSAYDQIGIGNPTSLRYRQEHPAKDLLGNLPVSSRPLLRNPRLKPYPSRLP